MDRPNRRPNRIPNYDYSQAGSYFITICTQDRIKLLSRIDPSGHLDLMSHGYVAEKYIRQMDFFYDHLSVDKYVIMPDHIHLVIRIDNDGSGRTQFAPTISRVIKQFKASITKKIGFTRLG